VRADEVSSTGRLASQLAAASPSVTGGVGATPPVNGQRILSTLAIFFRKNSFVAIHLGLEQRTNPFVRLSHPHWELAHFIPELVRFGGMDGDEAAGLA
jgi:hypothetical protein